MNISDDLTLIVVSYRSEELILKNLDVLRKFKVIIIDNSNSDKLESHIKKYKNIILVRSEKNLGYGKAVNLGVSKAKTCFILHVSPDILLNEKSIKILFSNFPEDENNIGILGPSLFDKNMNRRTNGTISYLKKLEGKKILNTTNNIPQGNMCCEYLVGCCYLMKKDFFTYLGGFDENFFMYFEDNDLCDRTVKNGKIIMEITSAKFIHLENSSSKKKKYTNHKLSIIHKVSSYVYLKKNVSVISLIFKILINFIDYFQRFIFNLLLFKFKKSFKNFLRLISIIIYITSTYKLIYNIWNI